MAYTYTHTHSWNQMSVKSNNKEMKGKKGTSPRRKSVFVNESSHCCVHSLSRFGIYRRERARDDVCVWITLGGRRPSEGFCSTHRQSAAAATSTSLLESRGLTLTCVTTTTTSKVLNRDFIFSTYILLHYEHIYPVGSKNNTYNILYTLYRRSGVRRPREKGRGRFHGRVSSTCKRQTLSTFFTT